MNIRTLLLAEDELTVALEYYENISIRTAEHFIDDFHDCVERIRQFPTAWAPITTTLRRCLFKKFEYSIIYTITPSEIIIICVMHNKQKPDYWLSRI
ncbi:MAG: type II toxin-antitoxin system RelE/ParE family toxin [Bacteroidota bacterium]